MLSILNDFLDSLVVMGGDSVQVCGAASGAASVGASSGEASGEECDAGSGAGRPRRASEASSCCTRVGNLKRLRRRRKEPFSNMSSAEGCSAQ